jgi:hypothetical protein
VAITVLTTPGKTFGSTELVDNDKLNQLGQPTFVITGTLASSDISNSAITATNVRADSYVYATSSFATPKYTLVWNPGTNVPASLSDGLEVCFKASNDNTGATTVDVGVGGAITIKKNKSEDLIAGDIVANQIVLLRYDTAAGVFQMQSHVSLPDSWRGTTAGTAPAYTVTLTPPGTALTPALTISVLQGRPIFLKVHAAGTGGDKLTVTLGTTAFAQKNLVKSFNQPTIVGDLQVNQQIVVVYDSTADAFQLINPTAFVQSGPVVADGRNIILRSNSSNPTYQVDVTADSLVLQHTTSAQTYLQVQSVSRTINFDSTGVDGLDTGIGPGSLLATWYYLFIISDGTNTRGYASLTATPTLPAGYVYRALLGCVFNKTAATNDLTLFIQSNRETFIAQGTIVSAAGTIAAATVTGAAATAFGNLVPPIAKKWRGLFAVTTANQSAIWIAPASNRVGNVYMLLNSAGTNTVDGATYFGGCPFELPLTITQSFYYQISSTGSGTSLFVTGFTI